jgi:hypothetical protein
MLLLRTVSTVILRKMSILEPSELSLPPASAHFLLGLHLDLEDCDNILIRNGGLCPNDMTLQLRRSYTSVHVIMAALKTGLCQSSSGQDLIPGQLMCFCGGQSSSEVHFFQVLLSFVSSFFTDCSTRSAVISVLTLLVNKLLKEIKGATYVTRSIH